MNSEVLKSSAKINLFLDIVGKREDGYHLIESLFHTIDLADIITIKDSKEYSINTSGEFALDDNTEDNIVSKVYRYFEDNHKLEKKYSISIVKNIPTGAGLGGGSSNAATVMKYLNSKIENPLTNEELLRLSPKFGADVAFFINGGSSLVSGIGEKLTAIKKLPYSVLLIYPDIHVSTKEAYSRFNISAFNKGNFQSFKKLLESDNIDFDSFKYCLYNIFEDNIFKFSSEIKNISIEISKLLNEKVVMSGSGSSLFIVYNNEDKLDKDYTKVKENFTHLKHIYKANLI